MEERRNAAWIGGSVLVKGAVVSSEDLVIDGRIGTYGSHYGTRAQAQAAQQGIGPAPTIVAFEGRAEAGVEFGEISIVTEALSRLAITR